MGDKKPKGEVMFDENHRNCPSFFLGTCVANDGRCVFDNCLVMFWINVMDKWVKELGLGED